MHLQIQSGTILGDMFSFILNATNLKHLDSSENSETAEIRKKDVYVDNVNSSFQSESEVMNFYMESRELMLRAGFNSRSWTSNSKTLRDIALKDNMLYTDEVALVCPPFALVTALILLVIEFMRALIRLMGMLFHSSTRALVN